MAQGATCLPGQGQVARLGLQDPELWLKPTNGEGLDWCALVQKQYRQLAMMPYRAWKELGPRTSLSLRTSLVLNALH